jgi:predicted glycosyl hydrolase (DUF1957 family)
MEAARAQNWAVEPQEKKSSMYETANVMSSALRGGAWKIRTNQETSELYKPHHQVADDISQMAERSGNGMRLKDKVVPVFN